MCVQFSTNTADDASKGDYATGENFAGAVFDGSVCSPHLNNVLAMAVGKQAVVSWDQNYVEVRRAVSPFS